MAVAIPFVVGAVTGYLAKEVVTDITGDESLGMIAGIAAGYWGGGLAAEGAGAIAGGGGESVQPGGPSLGTTSPQSMGEIGGATEGISTVGDGGAQLFGGAPTTTPEPGLLESAGSWVEKNPMAASMGFSAAGSIASQKMAEDEAREAEKRTAEREEARYEREHQAVDPSKVRQLSSVNEGLIEGGYRSPGTRLRESPSSDLPNYQQLLDRYKRKV